MKQHVAVPSELGYDYQDHFLSSADGTRLHAWQIKPKGPAIGTILFLHGNAENISTHFRAVLWLVDKGYRIFALDYRGYGLSQGKPELPQIYDDINAATIWIDKNYRSSSMPASHPVYLLGQSLGASLAIKYASINSDFNEKFDALIAEAAFARFGSIAKHVASKHWLTWGAQYPAQWLLSERFDPLDAISKLQNTPVLLIHSKDDQIIPYHFGESLYEAANTPKRFLTTQGAHIRAFAQADVRKQLLDFLQQHSPKAGQE